MMTRWLALALAATKTAKSAIERGRRDEEAKPRGNSHFQMNTFMIHKLQISAIRQTALATETLFLQFLINNCAHSIRIDSLYFPGGAVNRSLGEIEQMNY